MCTYTGVGRLYKTECKGAETLTSREIDKKLITLASPEERGERQRTKIRINQVKRLRRKINHWSGADERIVNKRPFEIRTSSFIKFINLRRLSLLISLVSKKKHKRYRVYRSLGVQT